MEAVEDGATGRFHPETRRLGDVLRGYTPFADGDVLWAKITPCMQNGKSFIAQNLVSGIGFGSTEFHVIRTRDDGLSNEFVWEFLNLDSLRKAAMYAFTGSAGHQRVPDSFLSGLPFPKLLPHAQKHLVGAMNAARSGRQRKLQQADELLSGLDGFVLDALGLDLPHAEGHRTTYAVRARAVRDAKTLYPDYFHPERLGVIRAVEERFSIKQTARLHEIADFVRDQKIVETGDDYLGLANIQSNTGERVTSTEEDGKGACFEYREDDVLFARLRPYLNKVYRAESDGVCSTEFHVIRAQRDTGKRVMPSYLAAVLRSSVVLAQTRHMMTGNTHPRLSNEDVVNLVVPVPTPQLQEKIAEEVIRRRAEARRLRAEAAELWEAAKRRFEEELLGPVPVDGAEA